MKCFHMFLNSSLKLFFNWDWDMRKCSVNDYIDFWTFIFLVWQNSFFVPIYCIAPSPAYVLSPKYSLYFLYYEMNCCGSFFTYISIVNFYLERVVRLVCTTHRLKFLIIFVIKLNKALRRQLLYTFQIIFCKSLKLCALRTTRNPIHVNQL